MLVALLAAAMLQISFIPAWRPLDVVPNLALALVMIVAIWVPTSEALVAAVAAGFILDMAGARNFGLWTGIFMLVVLVAGLVHRAGIELDQVAVPVVIVAVATLVATGLILAGLVRGAGHWSAGGTIGRLSLELVLNLMLVLLLRPLGRWALKARSGDSALGEL